MNQTTEPNPALPPVLMTSEHGSFARATIVERKPEIIRRVLADHSYPPHIGAALAALSDEIASRVVAPPAASAGDDESAFWRDQWTQYAGRTWLDLPWYFAETYFYRRLLEAVGYFGPGTWAGRDPFAPQKRVQEAAAIDQVGQVWPQISGSAQETRFAPLLYACLWGNRADLSNYTVRERAVGASTADQEHILIDDTATVQALLESGLGEVAFINDNVGADSLFDLALADYLLERGWVERVTFHLKDRPFFVSDAMPDDIGDMVGQLETCANEGLAALGERLDAARTAGTLTLTTDPFWSRSLCFEDMPEALCAQLAAADLVILKGDVNYRRLLGDRHWPHTTRLEEVGAYFPRPFLAVRTLKGEIIVGLQPGVADTLAASDPTWLINGKRGIIHLVGRS